MQRAIASPPEQPPLRMSIPSVGTVAAACATLVTMLTLAGSATAAGPGDRGSPIDPTGPNWLWPIEALAAGSLLAACWLARRVAPRSGLGLALISTGVLLPLAAGWSWLSPTVRATMVATTPLTIAGTAIVVLRWRTNPSAGEVAACRAVLAAVVASSVVLALGYNPFGDPTCELTCIDVPTRLAGVLTTRSATTIACLCVMAAAVVGVVGIIRHGRAPRLLSLTGIVTLTTFATLWAIRFEPWAPGPPTGPERMLPPLVAATVGTTVCIQILVTLHRRAAAGSVVKQLSDPAVPASSAGPILSIDFAAPGGTDWIDVQGRPVPAAMGPPKYVILSDASGPVARLALTPRADDFAVLSGFTPARRLALRNAQLSAVAQANIAQVQASQRRLVAISDAERRRIEHDLHDGAQQRLVSAAFYLKIVENLMGPASAATAELTAANEQLLQALGHLRVIAHGMFPSVLLEEGLVAALEEILAVAVLPAALITNLDRNDQRVLGNDVAMAAFAVVVGAIDAVIDPLPATRKEVTVTRENHTLTTRVRLETVGRPDFTRQMTDAADRVAAAGGRLTITRLPDHSQLVTAVFPCAW